MLHDKGYMLLILHTLIMDVNTDDSNKLKVFKAQILKI